MQNKEQVYFLEHVIDEIVCWDDSRPAYLISQKKLAWLSSEMKPLPAVTLGQFALWGLKREIIGKVSIHFTTTHSFK